MKTVNDEQTGNDYTRKEILDEILIFKDLIRENARFWHSSRKILLKARRRIVYLIDLLEKVGE